MKGAHCALLLCFTIGITGTVSEPIGRNYETISQNGGKRKKLMKVGLGSVTAAKSDAILLADTSPQLEEENPDGLLKLERLPGATSDSKDEGYTSTRKNYS